MKKQNSNILRHDVTQLNQVILALACEQALMKGESQTLGISDEVKALLKESSQAAIRLATECYTPLVRFNTDVLDKVLYSSDIYQPCANNVDDKLLQINHLGLNLTKSLCGERYVVANLWFGLTMDQCKRLSSIPFAQLYCLAQRSSDLFKLRFSDNPVAWKRILIVEMFEEERAIPIMQETALIAPQIRR